MNLLKSLGRSALLVVLCLVPNVAFGIIISTSIWSKGNKKILVIGSQHSGSLNADPAELAIDKVETDLFLNWLYSLSKFKTGFIIEANEESIHDLIKQREKFRGLCRTLPVFASDNKFKLGKIDFILGDRRTKLLRLFSNVYQDIITLSSNIMRIAELYLLPNKLELFCEGTKKQYGSQNTEDILKEFERISKKLMQEASNLEIDKAAQQYIIDDIKLVDAGLVKVKEHLALKEIDCKRSIVDLGFRHVTIREARDPFDFDNNGLEVGAKFKTFNELVHDYIFAPYFAIAEIGFQLALLNALEKYDTVVVYAGNDHILKLNQLLKSMDFEVKFDNQTVKKIVEQKFTPVQLKAILDGFVGFVKTNKLAIAIEDTSCGNCGKVGDKCCGRCKKVYYCSAECQKAHWKKHKTDCVSGEASVKREAIAKSGQGK